MQIITLLNQCYRFSGFVCHHARLSDDGKRLEIGVRPRVGSKAICSGCRRPAVGYEHLAERSFEFVPVWGFSVFLLYRMRRVHYKTCGVVVEQVPWADGKHSLTKAYMIFLARWAQTVMEGNRRLVPHLLG